MIRFVELIRVSTAGQAEKDTPETQRRALRRLRQSRPGTLVEEIEAPAVSGALPFAERPDLQRLQALAGRFDEVRVFALDRLTRNDDLRERAAIFGLLADCNARIVDASGRVIDPADEMGEIDYYLQTLFAGRERKKISARTMAGKRRAVEEGRLPHGSPPYARRYVKGKGWEVDHALAKVYRKVFQLALDGKSQRQIVAVLTEMNAPPPRRPQWARSTVARMLRDKAAIGEWHLWGTIIEVPPIIDRDTFERVQQRVVANRVQRTGRPPLCQDAMLRKLLECGICGRTMHVDNDRAGAKKIYRCASKQLGVDSPCRKQHDVASIDALVRERVTAFFSTGGVENAALSANPTQDLLATVRDEQETLASIASEEERLSLLFMRGSFSEAVLDKQSERLKANRLAAERRLRDARALLDAAEHAGDSMRLARERIEQIRKRIKTASPSEWRELAGLLFARIPGYGLRVFPDGRVEGRGLITFGDQGAKSIASTANKAAQTSGRLVQFPVTLRATTRPK